MSDAERIEQIEHFVHLQRYLHGCRFRVIADPEKEDAFIIEFEEASARQVRTLNYRLKLNLMTHIRTRAQKLLPYDKKLPKKVNNHK